MTRDRRMMVMVSAMAVVVAVAVSVTVAVPFGVRVAGFLRVLMVPMVLVVRMRVVTVSMGMSVSGMVRLIVTHVIIPRAGWLRSIGGRRAGTRFVGVLAVEPDRRVIVFALLSGRIRAWGFIHYESREKSLSGSSTCSSMPASMPLICRSAAR